MTEILNELAEAEALNQVFADWSSAWRYGDIVTALQNDEMPPEDFSVAVSYEWADQPELADCLEEARLTFLGFAQYVAEALTK